jgi:CubicO group peptidase (beta-lactamase class C family)
MLATGVIQYATGTSALEFAETTLFKPMGFRNYEWMHQDRSGFDLGGFGLRLRPIDMQKFGVLYLNGGTWQGVPIISRDWIGRSFAPWNRSRPASREPDYGWFWWTLTGRSGWLAHLANGWKGQRIAVLPRERLVVTMTGCIEEGEHAVFNDLVDRFVVPSVRGDRPLRRDPTTRARLDALLETVRLGPSRITAELEARMVPSITPKERHASFRIRN